MDTAVPVGEIVGKPEWKFWSKTSKTKICAVVAGIGAAMIDMAVAGLYQTGISSDSKVALAVVVGSGVVAGVLVGRVAYSCFRCS